MIGRRLLHYKITEKLGEGGMGVVYKARDAHLDRFVAVKVLPPEKVADENRKARFVQEAKAASALNHPNIVHIYDISADADHNFIAMEYVKGKTLHQLIGRNGLSLNETLKYAIQIADAMGRAHAAGIVHRDLKPSNVMVDEHGLVKVLDFGLAKLTETLPTDEDTPTRTLRAATEEGAIVGTAAYMSPEQAEGKKVDMRSDIFSFGAVLYEMVSGRRAFQSDSRMSTLSAVLRQEPKPIEDVPNDLRRIISRCLRKDPERRFQLMKDVKVDLEELKEESDLGALTATAPATVRISRRRLVMGLAVVSLACVAAVAYWLLPKQTTTAPQWKVRPVTNDEGVALSGTLSSDGRLVAYVSDRAGRLSSDLYVQQVTGGAPVRLTDGKLTVESAAFSPDGTQIAFRTRGSDSAVYVIPVIGGEPRRLSECSQPWINGKISYSPDGKWIATPVSMAYEYRLLVISTASGEVRTVAPKLFSNMNFVWSPDSIGLLSPSAGTLADLMRQAVDFLDSHDVWFVPIFGTPSATGLRSVIQSTLGGNQLAGTAAVGWLGENFYFRPSSNGDLWQVRLSPKTRRASGRARPVTSGWTKRQFLDISEGGNQMLFTDTGNARFGIWEIPLDAEKGRSRGEPRRLSPGRRNESYPYLAENGRSLAFLVWEADSASLRVQDSMTGKERILANIGAVESFGAFVVSRDSRWVSYRITDRKEQQVFVVPFQGGPPRKVCGNCGRATDWTQDGRYLVAHDLSGSENKIGLIDVQSGRTRVLLEGSQRMYGARLSPDGKWLVFSVLPAGDKKRRNCIVPFDPGKPVPEGDWVDLFDTLQEERWLRWSPHGDMLYFLRTAGGRSSVWAVRMNLQTGMAVGDPTEVYQPSELRTAISGDPAAIAITLAADRLILTLTELQSNLWLAEQQR